MKVFVAPLNTELIKRSGIGKAISHQKQALGIHNIECLCDTNEDFDIIHANAYDFTTLYWVKKAKRMGKKVVVHAHSTKEDFKNSFPFTNLVAPFFKGWIKYFYNQGHIVITPTPYSKRLLETYKLKRPIYAVSNGIDLAKFKPEVEAGRKFREEIGVGETQKLVITVGLPIKRKGIFDFVELAERMPEVTFVWCGGVNKNLLPPKVRLLIAKGEKLPNVRFLGYVEGINRAYQAADLFFMPTYEETEGIVMLEALATKTPVLAREIDAFKPWLEDDVNVVFGSNNDEFEQKIRWMLSDEKNSASYEKERITDAGYKVAEERSLQHVGGELKNLYDSLIAGKIGDER